jgi:hypothetical protein
MQGQAGAEELSKVTGIDKTQAMAHVAEINTKAAENLKVHVEPPKERQMFFKSGNSNALSGEILSDVVDFDKEMDVFINMFTAEFFEYSIKVGMNFDGLEFHAMLCGPKLFMLLSGCKLEKLIQIVPSNTLRDYEFKISKRVFRRGM